MKNYIKGLNFPIKSHYINRPPVKQQKIPAKRTAKVSDPI